MGPQSDALPRKSIGAMGWLRHSRLTPFLAIIDQALYALTNLVLQIVVARSISSDEYGAFSLGVLFFFVAALVQQALIIEPMFVFSRHRYGEQMAAYHNRLKRGWALGFGVLVVAVGGALSLGLWSFHLPVVAVSVFGFAIVSPASLYMWLLRRMALLLGHVHLAVIGGAVYAVSLLGLALPLWAAGRMSAVAGIVLTGIAASVACLVMLIVLPREAGRGSPPDDMFNQHLRYGRWALGSEIINWIIFNGPIAALPIWFGLTAAANFRIINLLFLPLLQTTSALTVVLLRVFAAPGGESTKPAVVLKYVGLLGVGAALYSAIAVAGGARLVSTIFGSAYSVSESWIWLAAAATTLNVVAYGFFAALRAREQSNRVLMANVAVMVVMIAFAPIVVRWGIDGILLAQTVGWGIAAPLSGAFVVFGRSGAIALRSKPSSDAPVAASEAVVEPTSEQLLSQ